MITTRAPANGSQKTHNPASQKKPIAEQILTNVQASRATIQDFVPLAESLEWQLGQQYLRERGSKAFTSDALPVPFVINNDGTLSRNVAEVFFASIKEADRSGDLEPDIFVLELGIGVGLFARYFLDHFQRLCITHHKDYYDRLCYIAADRSEQMLMDVCRHGVLACHPGRYRLRVVDALCPEKELPFDIAFRDHGGKPFRAVFLNYLLDCLPAAALELADDQVKQLCVRTCVARTVRLDEFTDLTVDQLKQRAASKDPNARQELLEVYGLFASEYDYRPVDIKQILYGEFTVDFIRKYGKRAMHNYGAMQCLERLLEIIHPKGFILMNEYGQTQISGEDDLAHQRFSLTTAVGLNFPLLKAYFEEAKGYTWLQPFGEERGIQTRLLGHKPAHEAVVCFHDRFRTPAFQWLEEPLEKARECAKNGRFEMAATFYNDALERQPSNWVLLNEISSFLIYQLRDPKAGIDIAKLAVALNPIASSELWNTLGDGLFELGRLSEARSAYLRALSVNDSDVRARYNLAWVYGRERDFGAALKMIAEAFTVDKMGQYRERLLQKLNELVAQLTMRHQQEYLLLINLVSKHAKRDEDEKPKQEFAAPRVETASG
jgi:tetratricopeptide (TPR) repeat protein